MNYQDALLAAPTTAVSKFREIIQNIVCERYADNDDALCAIDAAFEDDLITRWEARRLEFVLEMMVESE